MILIKIIGTIYLIFGFLSLLLALIFIELGRPRDLIKSGLIILLGIFLIIHQNSFSLSMTFLQTLNGILISLYIYEDFSCRWNQLLDKEKFEIKSFSGFISNTKIIVDIINGAFKNIFTQNTPEFSSKSNSKKKKWVRENSNNSELLSNQSTKKEVISNSKTANFSKEDIISDVKNKKQSSLIDKK